MNDTRREYDENGQYSDVPLNNDEQAALDAQRAIASAALFKSHALELLAKNDQVATRCVKAGIPYPPEWLAYDVALRAIVDSGMGNLPTQPDYPA